MVQLERQTIRERTLEGVAIAKAAGKYKGRKKGSIELRGKSRADKQLSDGFLRALAV